eukprot:gnl/TRDRNA2_/TRDRNA2_163180_c0_seq3.p1 gnl/TRDRNA2_/TRDRNA2_163180_c0~~gnl/TRDRNA2_/TRDRNA2_163180_c0_seq3.p1  ORF type:complete len:210 (-),score=28.88 gnl/TRDRNA2_/TRDRNA2_163180_c0_seq3:70-699(-)
MYGSSTMIPPGTQGQAMQTGGYGMQTGSFAYNVYEGYNSSGTGFQQNFTSRRFSTKDNRRIGGYSYFGDQRDATHQLSTLWNSLTGGNWTPSGHFGSMYANVPHAQLGANAPAQGATSSAGTAAGNSAVVGAQQQLLNNLDEEQDGGFGEEGTEYLGTDFKFMKSSGYWDMMAGPSGQPAPAAKPAAAPFAVAPAFQGQQGQKKLCGCC